MHMTLGNILGIGTDIVDARRIEALMQRHGERFLQRVYTQAERAYCETATDPTRRLLRYANRFAAKEAVYKALGGGGGLSWQEAEVVHSLSGAPLLLLHGAAATRTNSATSHLSLSDEYPYATAFVILVK
jgi:holo-[acyl-carrier protein] synthase